MQKFHGVYPAITTTFKADGTIDYESFTKLIRHLIKGGCHGITLFAIAGEYYKLSYEEEVKLIEITVLECKKGNVKSVINVTRHASEMAAEWAVYIQDAGADCLMLLPPFFLKPGAAAIIEHARLVNDAVSIPIMFQYAPEQTGVAIAPEMLIVITNELKNITILKIENKPSGKYVSKLLAQNPDIQIFVGNAGFQMIENFDRGARGVLPGCSMYDVYLKIYHAYLDGNRKKAIEIHNDLLVFLNHIRQNVEMIIKFEKMILKKRGIIASDYCRKPNYEPDSVQLAMFEEHYDLVSTHFDVG